MCVNVENRSRLLQQRAGGGACLCVDVESFRSSPQGGGRRRIFVWTWKSIRGSPYSGGRTHEYLCMCKRLWLPLRGEEKTHV